MDDRARVPFALVGVVLLVGSTTYAATMAPPARTGDPATERAIDRVEPTVVSVLRDAAVTAGRRAMLAPVTRPANTTLGRALDDPFRDALALRIHGRLRRSLTDVSVREGDVTVTASLPAATPRGAIERVSIARAGENGTAMRVRVRNVAAVARRDGRVVERVRLSPSVVVASPALAVHDRVRRFERAVTAGATRAGLARRVTAQLYAIAWARGYAQYGGAPIANVLATRHLSLATNRGLLSTQRATIGCPDADARAAMTLAGRRVAAADLARGAYLPPVAVKHGLRSIQPAEAVEGANRYGVSDAPEPNATMRVAVNASADAALLTVERRLDEVFAETYRARVRLVGESRRASIQRSGTRRPAGDWTLAARRVETRTSVRPASSGTVAVPEGWHPLRRYGRRVVTERVVVRRWRRGEETRTTRQVRTTIHRVTLAVLGRHAPAESAPERPIRTVHDRGHGPLSGPNLAGVEGRAVARLVAGRGGADTLARRAVADALDSTPVTIHGRHPEGLRRWVLGDLLDLRRRVRNVSVAVDRGAVGTFEVNPPAELATQVRERREALLDVPRTYGSVAAKARVAARGAYLDAVLATLGTRAERRRATRADVNASLTKRGTSLSDLSRWMRARRSATSPDCRPLGNDAVGDVRLTVDGTPSYLTTASLSRERLGLRGPGRVHPLAARNTNWFTLPFGEVADGVISGLLGPEHAPLRTAATTLRTADRIAEATDNATLVRRRTRLRRSVASAVAAVGDRLRVALARAGVGDSPAARADLVRAALWRWNTTAARALALTNGSAAGAVADEVAARHPGFDRQRAEYLEVRLSVALAEALRGDAARPARPQVVAAATTARSVGRVLLSEGLKKAVERRGARRVRRALGGLQSGLPVAPVPGYWYATTNLWTVTVAGRYERLVVRARRGRPPGGTLRYVRDGGTVAFDADADGTAELVGHDERVSVRVETAVVVVVPPGPPGVGDTGGNADERSAGWPPPRAPARAGLG